MSTTVRSALWFGAHLLPGGGIILAVAESARLCRGRPGDQQPPKGTRPIHEVEAAEESASVGGSAGQIWIKVWVCPPSPPPPPFSVLSQLSHEILQCSQKHFCPTFVSPPHFISVSFNSSLKSALSIALWWLLAQRSTKVGAHGVSFCSSVAFFCWHLRWMQPSSSCVLTVALFLQEHSAADIQPSEIFCIITSLIRRAPLMCECSKPRLPTINMETVVSESGSESSSHTRLCCHHSFMDLLRLKGTSVKRIDFQETRAPDTVWRQNS